MDRCARKKIYTRLERDFKKAEKAGTVGSAKTSELVLSWQEFIAFLNYLDSMIPAHITSVHVVCDNLSVHKGKEVLKWLSKQPRFVFHFTPVHCSWMNQVEQWFSILQRKRFIIPDFASIEDLRDKVYLYIEQWNQRAHPFKWTTKSVAKVMAYDEPLKEAA